MTDDTRTRLIWGLQEADGEGDENANDDDSNDTPEAKDEDKGEGTSQVSDDLQAQVATLTAELEKLTPLKKEVGGYRKRAKAAEQERDEAISKYEAMRSKVVNANLNAAAKGKLVDPSIAGELLDIDALELDADSDAEAFEAAIDKLVEDKPYLKAKGDDTPGLDEGHQGDAPEDKPTNNDWLRNAAANAE